MFGQVVRQQLNNPTTTLVAPSTPATAPPAASPGADAWKAGDAGVQSTPSGYTTASTNMFSKWTMPLRPAPGSVKTPAPGAAAAQPSSAQLRQEAQAESKLRSASLQVGDFEGVGADKAGELVSKMASGSAQQQQNLLRLMDDPDFAKHLGAALSKMDTAGGLRVLDTLHKSKPPSEQLAATLHRGLDAMDPARRGALMSEALKGADPEAKSAVRGYLDAKLASGQLWSEHLTGMDQTLASETLEKLALGAAKNSTQRGNLLKLMDNPRFSTALAPALETMKPEARQEVLRSAGDSQRVHATITLERAMDGMRASARNEMLRDAYLNGDRSVRNAANQYTARNAGRAVELFENLGTSKEVGLGEALRKLDGPALTSLVRGLGGLPEAKAQEQFRKLGDAVLGPPKDDHLRKSLLDTMKASPFEAGQLLGHVVKDREGNQRGNPNDTRVNNGQRLAADLFDGMNGTEVKQFLGQVNKAHAADLQTFVHRNARNPEVEKATDSGPDTRLARALLRNWLQHPGQPFLLGKQQGPEPKAEILKLLEKHDPSALIRDMNDNEVKDLVKKFLHDNDMGKLAQILPRLSPQSAAKLAGVVQAAAKETGAEKTEGSWLGDLLADVSLPAGINIGNLQKGAEKRDLNAMQRSLDDFTRTWSRLMKDRMSPNEKQLFVDKLLKPMEQGAVAQP